MREAIPSYIRLFIAISGSRSIFFLGVSLAIVGPLMSPGHLLTVDSVTAINRDIAGYFWGTSNGAGSVLAQTYNSAPFALVLHVLEQLIPGWLVERLWLILLFSLAGIGASRLPYLSGLGSLYAGLFYVVNPFTYLRFVTGQWGVLGAHALMPFLVTSFVQLMNRPDPRAAIKTAVVLTLIGFMQIQGLAIALLCMVVIYAAHWISKPRAQAKPVRMLALASAIFLGLNAFWIARYVAVAGSVTRNIAISEFQYFAAKPAIDVLTLRGFWASESYIDIVDLIPMWWLIFIPLFFLAIYGALRATFRGRAHAFIAAQVVLGIAGLVLAVGPTLPVTEPAFRALWDAFPLYRAFRDSDKFTTLAVMAYAYLGAVGLNQLMVQVRRRVQHQLRPHIVVGAIALGTVVAYGLPIFGAWGQIRPSQFPDDWIQARDILDRDERDFNVLVLPWHKYLDFPWLDNRINQLSNPAAMFFAQPTIAGDNIESGDSFSNSSNEVSGYVEALLKRRNDITQMGQLIAPLNAKYVVLWKVEDYTTYNFLAQQTDLELVFDSDEIALYKNVMHSSTIYIIDEPIQVADFDAFFDGVVTQANPNTSLSDTTQAPVVVSTNPITYEVAGAEGFHIALALPQNVTKKGWTYSGQAGELHLGTMPSFSGLPDGAEITFTPFYRMHLPLYALAIATLGGCVLLYRRRT